MRRGLFAIAMATIFGLLAATTSWAQQPQLIDPGEEWLVLEHPGGGWSLPVGASHTWQEAVQHARNMPGVQEAMQEFARRGYVAHPEHDTASVSAYPPSTTVILTYEKPGIWLPQYCYGGPAIVVCSAIPAGAEGPETMITAGILVVDAKNARVFAGDSLYDIAQSDPSFDVVGEGGSGPEDPMRRPVVHPSAMSAGTWAKWVKLGRCTAIAEFFCITSMFEYALIGGVLVITPLGATAGLLAWTICSTGGFVSCAISAATGLF